ncbi:MAG: ABC transporter substrate-binding protein, partial [Thermomicrobiales bacterium]
MCSRQPLRNGGKIMNLVNPRDRRLSRRSLIRGSAAGAALALTGAAHHAAAAPVYTPRSRSSRRQDAQQITLWVISSFTPDEEAPIYQAAQQYEDETDVEVVIEPAPASGMQDKLLTAVLGGEGPDVVSVDSAWNAGLAASGITSDVSERFAPIAGQYFPGPVDTGAYLGAQYAVPWYTNNVGLYYNQGLFTGAGIEAPPATWEELVSIGKELTSGEQYGLMLGSGGFGPFLGWPFVWQNGGSLLSEDGATAEFGNEAGLAAWQFYSGLYLSEGIVPEDIKSAGEAWDQLFAPFIQERTAMMFCGDWATFPITEGNPDLEFMVAPLPVGEEAATVIGGYNLAIPTTAPNPDASWAFIEWMTAVEQEWILQGYNRIQARADIVDTEYASQDPILQVFINQAAVGRARATVPAWDEIENTIMADTWDAIILEQATVEEAIASAVEQTNELLAE